LESKKVAKHCFNVHTWFYSIDKTKKKWINGIQLDETIFYAFKWSFVCVSLAWLSNERFQKQPC